MRTLIVQYLPRIPRSHSAKLLNHFKEAISSKGEIEELDLIQSPPPHFNEASLDAYIRRDDLFEELSAADSMSLEHFDTLTEQFMRYDVIAMAFRCTTSRFPGS